MSPSSKSLSLEKSRDIITREGQFSTNLSSERKASKTLLRIICNKSKRSFLVENA
ncbi:hypothetical protein RSSM_01164 [Rhodopirellula sallentina SM41]|uniref:Uncharacterized protein n=1 Tax=Rhodopirellula sallentina SM41 TaxID=1263870 RepID=M5UMU0_9BACT|nr:hypothetical protein RSSM_01164 [Rhodopirellula sallentina SM41]